MVVSSGYLTGNKSRMQLQHIDVLGWGARLSVRFPQPFVPEHISVRHYVVAVDLGEDPPVLKPPVQRLVTRPHPPLHSLILRRIRVVSRTFYFVGVAAVPLVGLDPLARLEKIMQHLVKYFNVGILTGRVRSLDPHQVPWRMSTPSS